MFILILAVFVGVLCWIIYERGKDGAPGSSWENRTETEIYVCPECGLGYKDKNWRNECELWCKKTKSCNLDINEHSIQKSV